MPQPFGSTPVPLDGTDHFRIASPVAALAAAGLTAVSVLAGDGRTVLLGMAFSTMTALPGVRGLATPWRAVGR